MLNEENNKFIKEVNLPNKGIKDGCPEIAVVH